MPLLVGCGVPRSIRISHLDEKREGKGNGTENQGVAGNLEMSEEALKQPEVDFPP